MATKRYYSVIRISRFLPAGHPLKNGETVVESRLAWPKAWRLAAKLNDEAREGFKTGRIMYDVPEYEVRENV